jgi:uncharacterized Rmd1/YagE family protein
VLLRTVQCPFLVTDVGRTFRNVTLGGNFSRIYFHGDQLSSQGTPRVTVRALLLGDRIDTAGLERPDILSATPLAFRVEAGAFVVIFRYGVVVLFGMTPLK